MNLLLVAAAGAFGAPMRYLVDLWVQRHTRGPFPWGTLLINTTGSLMLGLVCGLALFHGLPARTQLILGTGFCGAYTTFSTFAVEGVRLGQDGWRLKAAAYAIGSLIAGLLAAGAGLALAAAL